MALFERAHHLIALRARRAYSRRGDDSSQLLIKELLQDNRNYAAKAENYAAKVENYAAKVENYAAKVENYAMELEQARSTLKLRSYQYLKASRALNARCVLEQFENLQVNLTRSGKRETRWANFISSGENREFLELLHAANLDEKDVPAIACRLFLKLHQQVHSNFHAGIDKVIIVKECLQGDEFQLLKIICKCYPLDDEHVHVVEKMQHLGLWGR